MTDTLPMPLISEQTAAERLYLRPREVSSMTGLSEAEVYKSIYAGELRALKYKSRSWLIPRDAVDEWISSQSEPAA